MTLRIASYNLHKCKGTDRRTDPGRVVDVINSIGADILALQEVDYRLGDRPEALPRDLVERHTDHEALDLALSPVSLGWHGQTILVRQGLTVHSVDRIMLPGLEPRGAVMAEIGTSGGPLRVVGVHLGLLRHSRLKQLAAIRDAIGRRADMPSVILGDFNEWSASKGLEPLAGRYEVIAPGRSFHASRPVASLDRVALGAGLELRDAGVIETALSRRASDHLPIWSDIRLSDPGPSGAAGLRTGLIAGGLNDAAALRVAGDGGAGSG